MAERIINEYKRLFEIRLLHHYWLDEGAVVFDLIPEKKKRDNRLLSYDMRAFLTVLPTFETERTISSLRGVYKNTALGSIVAVPGSAVVPDEVIFQFMVMVKNPAIFKYTALTLRKQNIYEIYYPPEDKIYRYKENVPVLSNLTGASRRTRSDKSLFLSKEFSALSSDDLVESLVQSNGALVQLTGDQPGAGTHQIHSPATDLPVFVHQGDVPVIIPPQDLSGVPKRGIELTDDIADNTFALVHLSPVRADDADFSFIDGSGKAKDPHPVFQIRLKNRSTIWRYLNKKTGDVLSTEIQPFPLTYFGNAGTKQKPLEGLVKPVYSDTRIDKLVSEIYV
jgi:hypothetical protein